MNLEVTIFWYRKVREILLKRKAELERLRSQELPHEQEKISVENAARKLASLKEDIRVIFKNRHHV